MSTASRAGGTGRTPRAVFLAVFWLTSWSRSQVHAQAHNDAQLAVTLAHSLSEELAGLRRQVKHLAQLGQFGSANDPVAGSPETPCAALTTAGAYRQPTTNIVPRCLPAHAGLLD